MPHRLEITLKPDLIDAEGQALVQRARQHLGIRLEAVRTVQVLTIDAPLQPHALETIRTEVFTNPVTQISSFRPLDLDFDWIIWVGLRAGVRDNPGATAVEAIVDGLGTNLPEGAAVYASKRYCLKGQRLDRARIDRLAAGLLANDLIQQWRIWDKTTWDPAEGIGIIIPKVRLDHVPAVTAIPMAGDADLLAISRQRNLFLNPADVPVIRAYFNDPAVRAARAAVGLADPTDVELEYISQARSDHCNHNTFRGRFFYDEGNGVEEIDSLFATFIEAPTLALQRQKPWVVSVLWDNAGAARFDDDHLYTITGETHNSPSNMEAYGGALTGIVGVYRDPMGTGKGSRLIMGSYGFCVGPRDYAGPLKPRLHPRRLLDGVILGVRDGGNKSGIPTVFGQTVFHPGYMGKCLVFVTAVGIMPAMINGEPAHDKTILPGDAVVMVGGRVGKDGIHGVTASSETFSEATPAGHVQIGDPYTQKKMHDFLLEARDRGLIRFITDNGGGGLSSSVGESARFAGGCQVELDKVPLKYAGMDPWEIWVSESQERMTVAVAPENTGAFLALSRRHAVEATVIGAYTDSGCLHITFNGRTCAFIDLAFLGKGFAQWRFAARWISPAQRGLTEPVLGPVQDNGAVLLDLLAEPNIAAKQWITRQYDHEVQGTSVIKPLVGAARDVTSDAAVIRPVLGSNRGLAFSQALLPQYSAIDAYHMTSCTIDEAVRRLIAVGADPEQIGGVDNFCWPSITADPAANPDGPFKAAQLVRACKALADTCLAYGIPLLSGKDSMYVDGHLPGAYGQTHKVSALETLQFSATSVVADVNRCVTMDPKSPGDGVYVLGVTADELGASAFYEMLGTTGANVPQVNPEAFLPVYRAVHAAIQDERVASVHGVYRGGLGVHLALAAMGGRLGLDLDLAGVPVRSPLSLQALLFAESAGRFIVTVAPGQRRAFESRLAGLPWARIGKVTARPRLVINNGPATPLVDLPVAALVKAWNRPFGELR